MTREELRDYVEEQRNLDIIPYHVYSTLVDGIDTLEQEPKTDVLDKIKSYVDHIRNTGMGKKKSLEFIEKFIEGLKTESEE